MTRITLVLNFLGLSAFWGLVLGAGFGFVGGLIFSLSSLSPGTILYALILAIPISAVYGTFIGGVGGIVLGIITATFSYHDDDLTYYKWVALPVLCVITFFSIFLWFALQIDYALSSAVNGLVFVFIVATIGAVEAGFASRRIAKWYLSWHEYNYIRPITLTEEN